MLKAKLVKLSNVPMILESAEVTLRKEKPFDIEIKENKAGIEPGYYSNIAVADILKQMRVDLADFNEFIDLKSS